jgi:exopolyphosphatase/guanosine-5'-triphosphate,3'-diphosphate pyrophosphatase
MKIAAVDIGSNSIHLVIVEAGSSGTLHVLGREKEMVRLGTRTLTKGRLAADTMARGLETVRRYRRIAESKGVEKIVAAATSAVREAVNGEEFLDAVGRELGVRARAIAGEREARLIYLAALHSMHLTGQRTLVIDIGGGSVELALGKGDEIETAVSLKLGAIRMTERFVRKDPLLSSDEARLVEHVDAALAPHVERIRNGFERAVGTSGTILALGALAQRLDSSGSPVGLHHVTVRSESLHAVRRMLAASDLKARLRLPEVGESRADIIVAGGVVLDVLLKRLGVQELMLCEWALREGLILDYVHQHRRSLAQAEAYPDVRRRSVVGLAERCQYDEAHARHVASLALSLFDATRRRHRLGDGDRSLLEYAALLHDVGHHISYVGHHKHAYYLIKNGALRGFDPLEIEVLANVARYHRRGAPRKKHAAFASLPDAQRRSVRVLAACLRLADALDRSHRQVVRSLSVSQRGRGLRVLCEVEGDCELETWGAAGRRKLFEKVLGVSLRLEAMPVRNRRPGQARA